MKKGQILEVLALFLLFESSTSLFTGAYYHLLSSYSNRFPVSATLWNSSTADEIVCAERCSSDMSCHSFFFDLYNSDENCYGFHYRLTELHQANLIVTVFKQGVKYFQIDRGCDQTGYIYNKEHDLCFFVSTNTKTKTHADLVCQGSGGRLIVLDTVPKYLYMVDFMRKNYNETGCYAVGLTDTATEGTWIWSNGISLAAEIMSNFKANNQDDSFSDNRRNNADCACLNTGDSKNILSDKHCDKIQRFICEF